MSWPYYILLVLSLLAALRGRKYLIYFAVGLLFVQRPYVLSYGYSLFAVMSIWFILKSFYRSDAEISS